jgi:hypothetical protein
MVSELKDIQLGPVFIDANRAHDDEPWRLKRLDLLRRILFYHEYIFLKQTARVTGLYDHKGALAVSWTATPTKEQQSMLRDFWEGVFNEALVDHFVRGKQITDDCGWDGCPLPT